MEAAGLRSVNWFAKSKDVKLLHHGAPTARDEDFGRRVVTGKERWKEDPDEQDYPAALSYLSLVMSEERARDAVEMLEKAEVVRYLAKDLLRSSRLALLPPENFHVAKDLKKVAKGRKLSPVLLVAGDVQHDAPLTIADGYHRICASYHLTEDAPIPCRIIEFEGTARVESTPPARRGRSTTQSSTTK
jgi:hypothetical protein